jgi:hypothetical protein
MSKLKAIHVLIIGIVVAVAIGAGTFFLVIKKANERIAGLQGRKAQAEQTIATRSAMEQKLAAAKQKNVVLNAKLEKYMRTKMPAISFNDRAQGMIALWKEHAETLGPLINSWPRKTGVGITSEVQIPAPPVDPNIIDTNLVKIPLGSFTVSGDFLTLMSHVRSWNNFNRLVQVDVKSLTGQSPFMTLSYEATVYIFPRGEAGQTVPMASAGGPGMPGG